jgi:hypothetical protein
VLGWVFGEVPETEDIGHRSPLFIGSAHARPTVQRSRSGSPCARWALRAGSATATSTCSTLAGPVVSAVRPARRTFGLRAAGHVPAVPPLPRVGAVVPHFPVHACS